MFGLSLFRPSRQSSISTSGEERFKYPLPWENKISQMPYLKANKDNQIPTPCPASPPVGITLIGALGSNERQKQKLYNSAVKTVKFLKFDVMEPIHAQKNNL